MYDEKIELLIDGEWCQGSDGKAEDLINPATEEVLAEVPHASVADLDRALAASARGFKVWKAMTAQARHVIMMKAAELIEARKERIGRLLTMENGKPLAEAVPEVQFAADATRWYAEEGKRAYGRIVPARLPGVRQMVVKEPVGPVVAFAAWNFPSSNVIRKVAGALGAGCSVIIKPAEETPGTAVAIARCFQEAGVPAGVLNVVFGVPAEVSAHLLASSIPKKVTLTGSTAVGKLLQRQAADTLKRCTMELGGHAPVIVHEDADLEHALKTLVAFKFRNAGQVCTSPTRFFIHESHYDAFVGGFAERAAALKVGNGLEDGTQVGPMIAARRLDAMQGLVDDAVKAGARLMTGGTPTGNRGYFFAPTVLKDVPGDARIMSEEPFGPIAPMTPFSGFDDVIERANALPYGLASFVFTKSVSTAMKTEEALDAGLVGVNHMMVSTPETPFGGVNESGYGSESGIEGLEAFQRTKFVTEFAL
ncbi:Alpha-ketoglutaric semialdehyde dehydrogenase [Hartmannibacter diazotrophicus]|uniref:Alpha-ketoglutaric semialdehyde dehydrogenase n=1 Tax=Hartmannibacter diazotrophicus TaxID=1482074 RepID=A0A2C9D1V0_9HYPH|nr:NAD-dependent succinate-semialdehyde dehydrogenase [Hartmannibacter diazotrophicus]SON54357.1 Alpha-ketoglutaric semialdehyde dehydrogenase [Hartmannibacter diazotrophicus]